MLLGAALAGTAQAQMPFLTAAVPPRGEARAQPRPGAAPQHSVVGTAAAETLRGTPGPDAFRGQGGADTLIGGAGDDLYVVSGAEAIIEEADGGVDTALYAGQGTYLLPDHVENLVIQRATNRALHGRHIQHLGYAGGPSGIGNDLPNRMQGSAADNTLDGRGGNDLLIGGGGGDNFVFGPGYGHDRVADFEPGVDRVRIIAGRFDWAMLRDTPDGVVLALGEDSLTLEGRRLAELSPRDFELPPAPAAWRLTFAEEFSAGLLRFDGRSSPAGGVWRTRMAQGEGTIMGANDGQSFVDRAYRGLGLDPFSWRDGVLRIQGTWRPELREALGGREFASGIITTEGSFSQLYGYFEARMRLSDWPGGFPAFWLLPSDHAWPPEIDVMEQIGNRPGEIFQMGHTQPGIDTTQWHIYGLEWNAERIAWFVDGAMTHVVYGHNQHRPMYLLLNHALGGSWAGPVRRPEAPGGAVGHIEIDWVRAWAPSATPPAPDNAPRLRFSLGPLAPGGAPLAENTWALHARATGRLLLRPEDLGFAGLRSWLDITLLNDRAADSWRADVNNGWVGLNLQLEDADGGAITADDLTLVEIRLGGTGPSRVMLERVQHGLITTGAGNDTLEIRSQHNWMPGRGHMIEIRAGAGDDSITGWSTGHTAAFLRVEAGEGDDRVIGSSGPDILAGGPGDDVLTGGPGRDVFVLRRGEAGQDRITDFEPGTDRLLLEGFAPREAQLRDTPEGLLLRLPGQSLLLGGLALEGRAPAVVLALLLGGG